MQGDTNTNGKRDTPMQEATAPGSLYKRNKVQNVRVKSFRPLIPPALLLSQLPVPESLVPHLTESREILSHIVHTTDPEGRALAVVGPCSIHDEAAAIDYATQLSELIARKKDLYAPNLVVVMRVYFEKPRTTVGWKGLINDPHMDNTFDINHGLSLARSLLIKINALGLPVGCEFLDSISPQYTSDLVSWGAIGARTTESQIHRELASGLSCPIGFKNGTSGDVQVAADAVKSSRSGHRFLGVNDQGLAAIVETEGNEDAHIILRGGSSGPNYSKKDVDAAVAVSKAALVIDCSHGNSGKKHENQITVVREVGKQIEEGSWDICGIMVESNLVEGAQKLDVGVTKREDLKYGQSVTDQCVNLKTTEEMLDILAHAVQKRRELKATCK